MEAETSQIVIGWTDDARFIAIRPPLNDIELHMLQDQNLVRGSVEQVDEDPACTIISFPSRLHISPESATRQAQGVAVAIAEALGAARHRKVGVNPTPISMAASDRSPFSADLEVLASPVS